VGVPQGSSISPLLFYFFMNPLYDKLRAVKGVATVGIADDTKLLACGSETAQCVTALEEAWQVCDEWTRERSMTFEPAKSSLLHFTKTCMPRLEEASLGLVKVKLQTEARSLGVTLDPKLTLRATAPISPIDCAPRSSLSRVLRPRRGAQPCSGPWQPIRPSFGASSRT